jgi:hypothetical protein
MTSSRSRFFTLLCVVAMVAGIAAAAWARTAGPSSLDASSPGLETSSDAGLFQRSPT